MIVSLDIVNLNKLLSSTFLNSVSPENGDSELLLNLLLFCGGNFFFF